MLTFYLIMKYNTQLEKWPIHKGGTVSLFRRFFLKNLAYILILIYIYICIYLKMKTWNFMRGNSQRNNYICQVKQMKHKEFNGFVPHSQVHIYHLGGSHMLVTCVCSIGITFDK